MKTKRDLINLPKEKYDKMKWVVGKTDIECL